MDIIDGAEFDSSTALCYLVNLVARILQNELLSLNPGVAMPESRTEEKNILFGFLSNITFIICRICVDATET